MVRREIRKFELITEGGRYESQAPFSVKSVLAGAGVGADTVGSSVRFEAKIQVDDVALAMRNFYIRIKGISMPARVYINDALALRIDG